MKPSHMPISTPMLPRSGRRWNRSANLGVLSDADLVTTVKLGRERHYRLNVDELEEVAGGWIDRFSRRVR